MPDWLLERIFPYTQQTLASSKTILNMNTATLKLIAVGVAGGLLGFVAARLYFHSSTPSVLPAPLVQHEKSMEPAEPEKPVEPAKPVDPPISSIEQIDTSNPFNNKKFDPIVGEDEHVIGFMYKMEALKKALTRPPVSTPKKPQTFTKIGYATFDHQTKELLL
jgi:hypothetical protein